MLSETLFSHYKFLVVCNFTVPGQDTYTAYNIDEYEFFNYIYSDCVFRFVKMVAEIKNPENHIMATVTVGQTYVTNYIVLVLSNIFTDTIKHMLKNN